MSAPDAVIVGSGPNGLAAAIALASWGHSVTLYEAQDHVGGGLHSDTLTEPDFIHDRCSAIHPMGYLSPFFRSLRLEEHGLVWRTGKSSVAHPLDDGPAAILYRDFSRTGERLDGKDGRAWEKLFRPLASRWEQLLGDLMGPFQLPLDMGSATRFGWWGIRSARFLAANRWEGERARALFAGLAAHSILPLENSPSAAFGLIFGVAGHAADWPCAEGGSAKIATALSSKLRSLGGQVVTGHPIESVDELPPSKVVLFDLSPRGLCRLAGHHLPTGYLKRLDQYVYGPGTFKIDYTLDGSIPWKDQEVKGASTVHLGGTFAEIAASERAAWEGKAPSSPYLILCQQSEMDRTRAPAGKHTGYVYCHVPHGYEGDATSAIESQIERFAPGFRQIIRTRHVTNPRDFEALNPNLVGGTIAGGAATLSQLLTRPVSRWDPYSTPHPRYFLCSAATPPGGGVHGMCGYYAARSAAWRMKNPVTRGALLQTGSKAHLLPPTGA